MKRVLIIPDAHIEEETPEPYKVFKKFVKKEYKKIDEVVILGDFADVVSLNDWDNDKPLLMENRRYKREMDNVNKELDFLQKYFKKINYIEGNHENRATRYVEKHSEMEGLIEIPEVLHLEERGIKWIPDNIFEETGTFFKIGKMYFHHGLSANQNAAKTIMLKLGCNICCGHLHRYMVYVLNMAKQRPHIAYQLGCLCGKQAPYLKGKPSGWVNQFAVMDYNDDIFDLKPITMIDNKFIFNGKIYS